MTPQKLQIAFFFTLLTGVLALVFFVFFPYLGPLAVAASLAFVMQRPYRFFVRQLRGLESIAAMLTVLMTAILILLPLTLIGLQIFSETKDLYSTIAANKSVYSQTLQNLLAKYGQRFPFIQSFDIDTAIRQIADWLLAHLGGFFSQTLQLVINILLGSIAFFYFLKDGPSFIRSLIAYSPMVDKYDKEIFNRLGIAINSVMKGSLLVALIQGILTGVGLTIFGVPNATLWGSIAAVSALIPGIGTSLVLIPAIFFLFITGKTGSGFGLLIWGVTAVGLVDNLLGPRLMSSGIKIHPLLILFSVIGGVSFFGPLGFLFGPLALSLLFALLDIFNLIVLKKGV